jgi:hypothetical protein
MSYYAICAYSSRLEHNGEKQTEMKGDINGPFDSYHDAEQSFRMKYPSMWWANFVVVRKVTRGEAKTLDDTADAELCHQFRILQDSGRW